MDARTAYEQREDLEIVDVREDAEWKEGRIEGAVHIPLAELEERIGELDGARPVVTVCRSGQRSLRAADLLGDLGYRAESMEGGMQAWQDAGLPITTPDGSPGTVA